MTSSVDSNLEFSTNPLLRKTSEVGMSAKTDVTSSDPTAYVSKQFICAAFMGIFPI